MYIFLPNSPQKQQFPSLLRRLCDIATITDNQTRIPGCWKSVVCYLHIRFISLKRWLSWGKMSTYTDVHSCTSLPQDPVGRENWSSPHYPEWGQLVIADWIFLQHETDTRASLPLPKPTSTHLMQPADWTRCVGNSYQFSWSFITIIHSQMLSSNFYHAQPIFLAPTTSFLHLIFSSCCPFIPLVIFHLSLKPLTRSHHHLFTCSILHNAPYSAQYQFFFALPHSSLNLYALFHIMYCS